MNKNVKSSRNDTRLFEDAVENSFLFLEKEYGFIKKIHQTNQHSIFVRYENSLLYVNLIFGPPAYEPEMTFGRSGIDDAPEAFSFEAGDLIQLEGCGQRVHNPGFPEPIANQIKFLAAVLHDCGQKCLENDARTYEEMTKNREFAVAEWRDIEYARAVTGQIEAAWKANNYGEIVRICARFNGKLSAIDARRLAIAKARA